MHSKFLKRIHIYWHSCSSFVSEPSYLIHYKLTWQGSDDVQVSSREEEHHLSVEQQDFVSEHEVSFLYEVVGIDSVHGNSWHSSNRPPGLALLFLMLLWLVVNGTKTGEEKESLSWEYTNKTGAWLYTKYWRIFLLLICLPLSIVFNLKHIDCFMVRIYQ